MYKIICMALMLLGSSLCTMAQTVIKAKVDERVELVSIFSKVYGFHHGENLTFCSEYENDVEEYFNPLLRYIYSVCGNLRFQMYISELNYETLLKTALSLTIKNGEVSLNSRTSMLQERYDKKTVAAIVKMLNDFYKVTEFNKFYKSQQELYSSAESLYNKEVVAKFKGEIYKELYGVSSNDIKLYISMLNAKANYAIPESQEIILGLTSCPEEIKDEFRISSVSLNNMILAVAEILTYKDVLAYEKQLRESTEDYYKNCAMMLDKQHYRANDILFKQIAI